MASKNRMPVPEDALNQMQWYLGEETVEDYQDGLLSRRAMMKRLIIICGGSAAAATVLTACGVPVNAPPAATSAPATSAATSAPAATEAATAAATEAATAAATAEATGEATTEATAAATSEATSEATAGATAASTTAASTPAGTPAPAATPGQAKGPLTVPADDPAVQGSDVTFPGDVELKGYLARPAAAGTYPGVIVIHENRGLTDHIKDVARRLAKAGYIALAPDLVSRNGGSASTPFDQIAGILSQANPEDLVKDLSAGVTFLKMQEGVKAGKVGVVGFCFGGAYTLRLAAANPDIGAAVSYYGPAPQPVDQMANTQAAILGQYGGNDARVNGTIPDMEKVLTDAGKTFKKNTYEGANHAFNNDTGANYNEAAAVQAWQATLDWFKANL